MIDFIHIDRIENDGATFGNWMKLHLPVNPDPEHKWFNGNLIRINGVIYLKLCPEFITAFEQERVWEQLQQ